MSGYDCEEGVIGIAMPQTQDWPDGCVSGLSVLAWPAHLFHNYGALLRELAIDTEEVAFRFHELMA
jgi:hypothetical protein